MENPWLNIPAEDYEGHMSSDKVLQLQALSKIFSNVIAKTVPHSMMLLGCAAGNGLEHLKENEKIICVDINPDYIELCRKRFSSSLPNIEFVCADLNNYERLDEQVDLVHAALIFEYVDVESLLKKIFNWLKPGGHLSAVIQLESKTTPAISETGYDSLKLLSPIHKLVNPENFRNSCINAGFHELNYREVFLPGEKRFGVLIFVKNK